MKQYDKIYVHCHSMQSNLEIVLESGECGKSVKRVDNVLVMTIEELRDVWDAGWKRCAFETSENSALFPDFEPYITSKGINP